ncbi:MAG: hypothetical protein M9894_38485 [Planctomycetes bacterium]|nr:hypothetical protein [Planctomycetota bacterium]
MTDVRLRALEREATRGDLEAAARLLRSQVRLGALDAPRLGLLAYAGDPAAALAHPGAPTPPDDPKAWVLGLEPWGAEACVRAAVAAARLALPQWEARRPDPRPRQAVAAVDAWLAAPGQAEALACRAQAEELWADVPHGPEAWPAVGAWFVVAAAAWAPAPWGTTGPLTSVRLVAEAAARCASLALGDDLPYYLARGSVRPCAPAAPLLAALRGAVAAWARTPSLAA